MSGTYHIKTVFLLGPVWNLIFLGMGIEFRLCNICHILIFLSLSVYYFHVLTHDSSWSSFIYICRYLLFACTLNYC